MHAVAVGSAIQLFNAVTSVVVAVHVALSHFAASTLGKVVEAEYVVIQAVDVGSVMQLFIGVTSVVISAIILGSVVDAENVAVQPAAVRITHAFIWLLCIQEGKQV